jgi:hemolysin III
MWHASEGATMNSMESAAHRLPNYTTGEEIANAVSHGIGCALAIAALILLTIRGASHGGAHVAAALFMGIPLVLEYLFSTLYHAVQPKRAKAVLRIFDHALIYVVIAGSYGPFALVTLADAGGLRLFVTLCVIAVIGAAAEAILQERQPGWITTVIYVAMGWAALIHMADLIELLPAPAFRLLVAGGICYSVGVVFYALHKVRYMHFVFHLFVLAGSVCITLAALLFIV